MKKIKKILPNSGFWQSNRGATSIEYALIITLVFLAFITAVQRTGQETTDMFNHISNAVSSAR